MTSPAPHTSVDLDQARLELDRRKLALDESWPRKWGAVLLGAAATISAAIVTAGVGLVSQWSRQAEDKRAQDAASLQRNVENDRTALDMYFRYVAEKPEDSPHRSDHIWVLQAIAHSPDLLAKLRSEQTKSAIESRTGGATPSDVSVGLPDVKAQLVGHAYGPADFLMYVQYYEPRADASEDVTKALGSLGIRVPGQQAMPIGKSPDRNQIRVYRREHLTYARGFAAQLKQATGLDFEVVGPIGGGRLPDGIMEIWLGTKA